jgi:hypothetical protein
MDSFMITARDGPFPFVGRFAPRLRLVALRQTFVFRGQNSRLRLGRGERDGALPAQSESGIDLAS